MNNTVLIAEDDPNIRSAIREFLQLDGWKVLEAADGGQAKDMLQTMPVDIVLSDIRMPVLDGHQLLAWVREQGPGIPVIFITAHGDVTDAVQALQDGAADYLLKPFDFMELSQRLQRCLQTQNQERLLRLKPKVWNDGWYLPMEGSMQALLRMAGKAAPTDSTVLITGESGTGKEVIARYIHSSSPRQDGPFVAVNAGAIPESLLESELFGHEKGAFSGATQRRIGYFEAAQKGTLFLDEIGELPLAMQVKLLRVMQERVLVRLGNTTPVPLDIRIIAATNRNLADMAAQGSFRQDLYYRIQVINLHLPPLRDRTDDIPGLAQFLLPGLATRLGIHPVPNLSAAAIRALQAYPFPGNIRELENILERALIIGSDSPELGPVQLGLSADTAVPTGPALVKAGFTTANSNKPDMTQALDVSLPVSFLLADWERYAIERALAHSGGNRTQAAQLLGMGRRTLQEKIRSYGLADH
jgi:two-component system response regulator AtoC